MAVMANVIWELPVQELPKERLGMGEEQEQGAHSGPDTKDMYAAGDSKVKGKTQLQGATTEDEYIAKDREKQGKSQRLTKRDLLDRDYFQQGPHGGRGEERTRGRDDQGGGGQGGN